MSDDKITVGSGDIWKDLGIMGPAEALAESWASIDGKLDYFKKERGQPIPDSDEECKRLDFRGHYEGYMAEAEEMIERLKKRGWALAPVSYLNRGGAVGEEFPRAGE